MSTVHDPTYLPTPRQIAEACEEIRRTWTIAEHRRRAVGWTVCDAARRWQPPQIDISACLSQVRRTVLELT